MNNEKLIEQLKRAERYSVGAASHMFREAVAEIERLEKELKNRIKEIKDLEHILVGRIEENTQLNELLRRTTITRAKFPEVDSNSGLSDRDHIAIAALEGCLSAKGWHPEYIIPSGGGHLGGQRAADAAAESAYKYADAMLKAREK